jgi:hypothetical protein
LNAQRPGVLIKLIEAPIDSDGVIDSADKILIVDINQVNGHIQVIILKVVNDLLKFFLLAELNCQ